MLTKTAIRDFALCLLEEGDRATLDALACQAKEKIIAGGGEYSFLLSRTIGSRSAGEELLVDAFTMFQTIKTAIKDWEKACNGNYTKRNVTSLDFRNNCY